MVTPTTAALSIVRTTSGTTGSLTNEAMSELNWTALGYPRYTVYQITSTTKRYLARSAVPTFRYDPAGGTTWETLTPAEIQYAGGVIITSTPINSASVVQCASATYYTTITDLLGGSVAKVTNGPTLVDCTLLGDGFVRRYPTIKDFSVTLDTFAVKTQATYPTAFAGDDNDIVFTHAAGGTAGNSCTITMNNTAASASLSVAVSGTDVVVTLEDDGKDVTSTALEVVNAINQSPDCNFIHFTAALAAGDDGSGIVEAFTEQSLTGGLEITDHTAKFGVDLIIEVYFSTSADSRLEGYAYLESIDGTFDPKDVIKQNLSFKGNGPLYLRTS